MADTTRHERESVRLFDILDAIGASHRTKQKFREAFVAQEIALTFIEPDLSAFIFGSCSEGTTTLGLNSDIDTLHCLDSLRVVYKVDEGPEVGECILALFDSTKPGYVQLQSVSNRIPQTVVHRKPEPIIEDIDKYGRICYKHFSTIGMYPGVNKRSGPSDVFQIPDNSGEQDTVHAVRSTTLPPIKTTLLKDQTRKDWPSREQLEKMIGQGCFFVGVGHPTSSNKHLEWRISFSLQEREIMFSLNPTQNKCYILLKMIKKDIIHPQIEKSITSYHCKTCLFYTIQNTGNQFWVPENLLQAVSLCLQQILAWIEDGHCPNFFVPDENMFDKVADVSLSKVADIIKEELLNGIDFISQIRSDNVGELWMSSSVQSLSEVWLQRDSELNLKLLFTHLLRIYFLRRSLVRKIHSPITSASAQLSDLMKQLQFLQSDRSDSNHTVDDFQKALRPVLPHIELQIAQFTANAILATQIASNREDLTLKFSRHIEASKTCDLISAKLIQATHWFNLNKLDECQNILHSCMRSVESFVISACQCYRRKRYHSDEFEEMVRTPHMSIDEIREKCTTGCLLFLPAVADMVPLALQYEMYRSLYTDHNPRIEDARYWFDWMLVDSQVYLYYLQYLVYAKQNNSVGRREMLPRLACLLGSDPNLGHLETGFNLLGWMSLQEDMLYQALFAFCTSWKIRPHHNAAKWHLALVFYKYSSLIRCKAKK